MHRPVLVVAPGRSGTSTVARLLHEVFHIKMGTHFHPPDEHNRKGYYEDLDFRKLDESLANPKPPHQLIAAPFWEVLTRQSLEAKAAEDVPWGYKEPRLSFFLGYHVDILRHAVGVEPLVLWPRRPIHKVASSVHMRREGWDKLWEAIGAVAMRDYTLQQTLLALEVTYYQFWFHKMDRNETPDKEVVQWIKTCLDKEGMEYDKDSVQTFMAVEEASEVT